ncbi:hypothetical protein BQ8794_50631 [Mesorhizobium prunaredense]|uniref:Transport-associated OB type 2 domain-containing protein n=1 Tax=Mesorhizobium prunaredense TaxID=1631249 RepID=A0A1R3VF50_9HYPH|nr:TOBE domain-containing protein [Mesorhizobium prunaredense]SIT58529.1 hypothetical protein BQ8794_50631 [Mesorhizobium prunaredense]
MRGKMIVSIRPESFRFNRDNDTTQSAMGRVEDVIFIGSRSFYTICPADGVRAVGSHPRCDRRRNRRKPSFQSIRVK